MIETEEEDDEMDQDDPLEEDEESQEDPKGSSQDYKVNIIFPDPFVYIHLLFFFVYRCICLVNH